jgi:hypothetical protein
MADQVQVRNVIEASFSSGDVRVLADVVRAVANGKLTTSELQNTLSERRVTEERLPAWIYFTKDCERIPSYRLWLIESRPKTAPGNQLLISFFSAIENVRIYECEAVVKVGLGGITEGWNEEAERRLCRSNAGVKILIHHLKRTYWGAWEWPSPMPI